MYSGPHGSQYPTNWALNPVAYQNVSADQVDWASLAQQWILMKETCPSTEMVPPAPPPPQINPLIQTAEQGEAPMDVENDDDLLSAAAAGSQWSTAGWNYSGPSWQSGPSTNNWAWAGSGTPPGVAPASATNLIGSASGIIAQGSIPSRSSPPVIAPPPPPPIVSDISVSNAKPSLLPTPYNNFGDIPFHNNQSSSEHSSAYWNATSTSHNSASSSRSRLSLSSKVELPSIMPNFFSNSFTLDAAKRKQLPAWIREGLEKMERQKQKQVDREKEIKDREIYLEQKRIAEEEAMRELEKEGKPIAPKKCRFDSDSDDEDKSKRLIERDQPWAGSKPLPAIKTKIEKPIIQPKIIPQKTREERLQDVMMNVRRVLTQILLEVTTEELTIVCEEVVKRVRSTAPAQTLRKTQALTSLTGGLGLGIYGGDSSGDSNGSDNSGGANEDQNKDSDIELQDVISKRKAAFEKTSREIEARMEAEQVRATRRQKISDKVVDYSDNEVASPTDGEPLDKKQSPAGKIKHVASPNPRKPNYDKNILKQKSFTSKEIYNKHDQKPSFKLESHIDNISKNESCSKNKHDPKSESEDSDSASTSSDGSSSTTSSSDGSSDKHSRKRQNKGGQKRRYKKSKKTKNKNEFKQPQKVSKTDTKEIYEISNRERLYKEQQNNKTTTRKSSKETNWHDSVESTKSRKGRSKSRGSHKSRSSERAHKSHYRKSRSRSIENQKYNRRKSRSRSLSSRRSQHYTRSPSPVRRRTSLSKSSKKYSRNTRSSSRDSVGRSNSRNPDRHIRSSSNLRYPRRRSRSTLRRRSSTMERDDRNGSRGRHRSRGRRSSRSRKSRSRDRLSSRSRSSSRRYRSRSRGKKSSHKH